MTRERRTGLGLALLALLVAGCAHTPQPITTPSGLSYTVLRQGTGEPARPGQHVRIHETTMLADGRVHFSTRAKGQPLRFLLGGKQVIDGVDEAVTGMRVGEQRKLVVPPALSQRSSYPKGLSPKDTLHYEIELVAIDTP